MYDCDMQALHLSLHTHRLEDGLWVEDRLGAARLGEALASLPQLSSLVIDPPLALCHTYGPIPFLGEVVQGCLKGAPCLDHLRVGNIFKGFCRCLYFLHNGFSLLFVIFPYSPSVAYQGGYIYVTYTCVLSTA